MKPFKCKITRFWLTDAEDLLSDEYHGQGVTFWAIYQHFPLSRLTGRL